ncbi:MAG TPA: hypothetical protein VN934_02030 [Candidatus Tumulicola sp.]|nr:hypothetical protein [Candidatus Tumulicola sp.]
MRRLLIVAIFAALVTPSAALAAAPDAGIARAVSSVKCYAENAVKPVATTSVFFNAFAAVGVQCGNAAWVLVLRHGAAGWIKVGDTLSNAGTTIPFAMQGVPADAAKGLWDRWRAWGADQNARPGSKDDLAAIKSASLKRAPKLKVLHTVVYGDWGLMFWSESVAGGEELWHKARGVWSRVAGGGGAMDPLLLSAFGVPYSIAMRLAPS